MTSSVTYSGAEVAVLVGIIAGALPALYDADFEVADLLLDKAMAALPRPIAPELEARITRLRASPTERFWTRLTERIPPGLTFDWIDAGLLAGVSSSRALILLEELLGKQPGLRRVDQDHWMIAS